MKKDESFVPVKTILRIINSCETSKQMRGCKRIIELYTKYLKNKGVRNYEEVKDRLMVEFNSKKFQLRMIKKFIRNYEKEYREILENVA